MASILLVEDSMSQLKVLSAGLQHQGHQVQEATNGKEGLALVEQHRFEAIITDYVMPDVNGLEFTETARTLENARSVPIVMLTADNSPELRKNAKRAGINALVIKPLKLHQIIRQLDKLIPELQTEHKGV